MIRVVLDTNILISALLQPKGLPARALLSALAGTKAQLCVSGDIYAEYEEVIRRPKFNRSEAIIDLALRAIRQNGLGSSLPRASALVPTPTTTFFWSVPKPHALITL
jgi:hypothetical protein